MRLHYRPADQTELVDTTVWHDLYEVNDYTTTLFIPGLEPSATYEYRAHFDGGALTPWYRFRTFPEVGTRGKFDFVFSACFREVYLPHTVFTHIAGLDPTFVALMGDSMYGDYDGNLNSGSAGTYLAAFRQKYQTNFDAPFQAMSSQIPIMAIWDDHDYGTDNSDRNYPHRDVASQVFKESFPTYPYETDSEGLYYRFTVADADIFVLDTRWYRWPMDDSDGPLKTMLGETQLTWLLDGLEQTDAVFKIVISSVSLNNYGGDTSSDRRGLDSWAGYLYERDRILAHITDKNLTGVVFFSGDQHYPSVNIINWSQLPQSEEFTDSSSVYATAEIGSAVLDISASPFNYKMAGGSKPYSQHIPDPDYSLEIFRAPWAFPGVNRPSSATSVYGYATIDTESPVPTLTASFHQLNDQTGEYDQIYQFVLKSEHTVEILRSTPIPKTLQLHQNYPNPFNPQTQLEFTLAVSSGIRLVVYDLLGNQIITLMNETLSAGAHSVTWNGRNQQGKQVSSGIYIAKLITQGSLETIKMVLLR